MTWNLSYGSAADFINDVTIDERQVLDENEKRREENTKRRKEGSTLPQMPEVSMPVRPTNLPAEQVAVARGAAQFILGRKVVPPEVVVRLGGHDGPENQTDSITVTVSQR